MEPTASSLVDLCLEDVLQDVTGDDSSPERVSQTRCSTLFAWAKPTLGTHCGAAAFLQASEGWSLADREASTNNQQAGPAEPEEVTSEQQYRDEDNKHISQAEMEMADESEGQQEENTTDTAADVQSQSEAYAEPEPESVPTQSSLPQQDQFIIEQSLQRAPTDTEEQLAEAPETKHPSGHAQKDRSAALLSKELRKLQAETTVLQEHSRRLQEKAAVIQQQRAADQAGSASKCTCTLRLFFIPLSQVGQYI